VWKEAAQNSWKLLILLEVVLNFVHSRSAEALLPAIDLPPPVSRFEYMASIRSGCWPPH
jgi:hypothetical protein